MKNVKIALAALLFAPLAVTAAAQSLTGSIAGTVKDEQGGVLPGVTLDLTGKTGVKSTVTEGSGEYRFLAVEPGTYELTAALAGFQPLKQADVIVSIGKTLPVDFTLKLAGVEIAVAVVAAAAVVDITTNEATTLVSQELLFNLPINRNGGVDVLNYTPGINSGSAFGGDAFTGNALLLDGVDTRDPYSGTPWTFYSYNLIEEVQVGGLGASAEYGAFTGAVVNTITKSGGNRFAGLFDAVYSEDSLSGDNASDEARLLNPALADPAKTQKYLDLTAQLGGPIVRDKLFFFASAQRYELNRNPTGPITRSTEVDPRLNLKLTWQPRTSDTLTTTLQYDAYDITGRECFCGALVSTDELTVNEDSAEYVWGATWRHIFGAKTFTEVKLTGYDGYFDLDPKVDEPGRLDLGTGEFSVSNGAFFHADRGRNQMNASISHFAEAFSAKHDFKFGVEIERSRVSNRFGLVDDIAYSDYYGVPLYGYSYGYDISAANHREAFYVQDAAQVGDRITLNAGLRLDLIRGFDRATDEKDYDVKTWAPRIGFALDLTGDRKTALKAHYGRYYEGAFVAAFDRVLSGQQDFVVFDITGNSPLEIARFPDSTSYRIDPGIRHPRVDQFTLGVERALTGDLRLALTGIWRENKSFINSVIPSARWAPVTVTNELSGQPLTLYSWDNIDESESDLMITNPDDFQYRDTEGRVIGAASAKRRYRGLLFALSKRLRNGWQLEASYVLSRTDGTVDNEDSSVFGGDHNRLLFETPTLALVNSQGRLSLDRRHELKLLASYEVPRIGLGLNAYYRYLSGRTYSAFQRFSSRVIQFPDSAGREPWLEPIGSRRIEALSSLDLRIEKPFKLGTAGRNRLAVYADVTNVFNAGTATRVFRRFPTTEIAGIEQPVPFAAPGTLIPPRVVALGARWSF